MGDSFLLFGLSLAIVFVISVGIWIAKITKKQRNEMKTEKPKVIDLDAPCKEPEEMYAIVIDMSCCAKLVGIKEPKAVNEFIITFKTADDKIINVSVPQEMYDGFEIEQKGLLKLINGELYSFEIDE